MPGGDEEDELDRLIARLPSGTPPQRELSFWEHLSQEIPDALAGFAEHSGLSAAGARIGSALEAPFIGEDAAERHRASAMDAAHATTAAAERRSPMATTVVGGSLGRAAPMAMSLPGRAASLVSSVIRSLFETGAVGLLTSEGTTPAEVLADSGTAVMAGSPFVAAAHLPGAMSESFLSAPRQRVRDVERVTSPGGGAADVVRAESMPGGVSGQAARMREMRIPRAFDTPADIAAGARAAGDQAYGESGGIRRAFEEAGGGVPIEDIHRALEGVASHADAEPELRLAGIPESIRARRDAYTAGMGESPSRTIPRVRGEARALMEQRLGDLLAARPDYGTPPGLAQAQRGLGAAESREAALLGAGEEGAVGRRRGLLARDEFSRRAYGDEEPGTPEQQRAIDAHAGTSPGELPIATARPTIDALAAGREAPAPSRPTTIEEIFGPQPRSREALAERHADVERRAEIPDLRGDLEARQLAVPLSDYEAQLQRLGRDTRYVTPIGAHMPIGDEAMAQQYSALRDLGDQMVAETLPGGSATADRFERSRLRTQTAHAARTQAERAIARSASPSLVGGLSGAAATAAGAQAAGPAGAAAARVGHGILAPRYRALRTVTQDTIASMLRSPRTEALGRLLQRVERGGRLAVVHQVLSRSPEYADAVRSADAAPDPFQQIEGLDVADDSTDESTDPFRQIEGLDFGEAP